MRRRNLQDADQRSTDRGFTLVELLIVIVILGVLAVVTVLAVRGITDQGQESSEGADLHNLETGIEAYWVDHGHNPTEAELVTAELLTAESDLHDIHVAADGSYTIVNLRTSATVGGGGATTVTTTPVTTTPDTTTPDTTTPETTTPTTLPATDPYGWLGTATTIGGVPAVTYGEGPSVEVQIGGATIREQWNAMVTNGDPTPTGLRYIFIDARNITSPEAARQIATAAAGYTDFDIYLVDDTAEMENPAFGTYGCVFDFFDQADDIAERPDRFTGSALR